MCTLWLWAGSVNLSDYRLPVLWSRMQTPDPTGVIRCPLLAYYLCPSDLCLCMFPSLQSLLYFVDHHSDGNHESYVIYYAFPSLDFLPKHTYWLETGEIGFKVGLFWTDTFYFLHYNICIFCFKKKKHHLQTYLFVSQTILFLMFPARPQKRHFPCKCAATGNIAVLNFCGILIQNFERIPLKCLIQLVIKIIL